MSAESRSFETTPPTEKFQTKPGEGFNPQSPEEYTKQKEDQKNREIKEAKDKRTEEVKKELEKSFDMQFPAETQRLQRMNIPPTSQTITDNSGNAFKTNDSTIQWQTRTDYKKNPGRDEGGI
jgi:hypothetical protein